MSIDMGTAIAYLDLDKSKFASGFKSALQDLREVGDESSKIGDKINSVGSSISNVGKGLTLGVTAPLIGAGTAATKFAVDFEQGIAKVSTVADTTVMSVDEIAKGVKGLAPAVGITVGELNDALYETISATNDTGNSLKYLEIAAKLAKGGFTTVNSAVNGATSVINAYGQQGAEAFQKVSDIMIQTQNYGKTTVDELAASLYNVIPTAAAAGISFEQVGAGLAAITAQGTPTNVATTQMRAAINAFIKPNEQMASGLGKVVEQLIKQGKISGENAQAFVDLNKASDSVVAKMAELKKAGLDDTKAGKERQKQYKELEKEYKNYQKAISGVSAEMGIQVLETQGLQGSLSLLSDSVGGSKNQLGEMLGSVEAVNATLQLTSETGMAKYKTSLEGINNSAGSTEKAFKIMNETTKGGFEGLKASAETLAISFGELIVPMLQTVVGWIQGVVDWLNQLDEGTKNTILTVAGIAAAVGPILILIGKVVSSIGSIIGIIPKLQAAFSLLATPPAGIILLVVAALAALALIIANLPTSLDKLNEKTAEQIKTITPWADEYAKAAGKISDVNNVIGAHGEKLSDIEENIKSTEAKITEIYQTALKDHGGLRQEDIASIQEYLRQLADLNTQKLEMYATNAAAVGQQILMEMQMKGELTDSELAELQKKLDNANAQLAEARSAAEQSEIQQLYAFHQQKGDVNSTAHQTELQAIISRYDELENEANGHYDQMATFLVNSNKDIDRVRNDGYGEMSKSNALYIAAWEKLEKRRKEINNMGWVEQQLHVGEMNAINAMQAELERKAADEMLGIYEKRNADADNAYLTHMAIAKAGGKELTETEKQTIRDILYAWAPVADQMEGEGKDAMLGLLKGMEGQIPELTGLADKSTYDILDSVKKGFDIKSPSKKMEKIGGQVTMGLKDGMHDKIPSLLDVARSIANSVLGAIKSMFGIKSPSREGKKIGQNIGQSIGSGLLDSIGYTRNAAKKLSEETLAALQSDGIELDGYGVSSGKTGGTPKGNNMGVGKNIHNEFHLHSGKPLSPLEAANEFERMTHRLAEEMQ
jgi:hypothetical protein